MAWPVNQLARTGSSSGLLFQTCEWQARQVSVAGMPALGALSTVAWQYRQSMRSSCTWCRWSNITGWTICSCWLRP